MSASYDVVVLGGGTAGCVLAARLSEEPERSVCLVEAGPDYGPYDAGAWPADLLDARQLAFSHSWETDDEDDRSQLRARVIGGCSAHNACVVIEGIKRQTALRCHAQGSLGGDEQPQTRQRLKQLGERRGRR